MITALASVQDRAKAPNDNACREIPPAREQGFPLYASTGGPV